MNQRGEDIVAELRIPDWWNDMASSAGDLHVGRVFAVEVTEDVLRRVYSERTPDDATLKFFDKRREPQKRKGKSGGKNPPRFRTDTLWPAIRYR